MENKVASARPVAAKTMPDSRRQIYELNGLLSSVITTIQGQMEVNAALTVRLLALETKITQLDGQLQKSGHSGN
jgi:hypothetical protein